MKSVLTSERDVLYSHPIEEFANAAQLSRGEKIRLMYRNLVKTVREAPAEPGVQRMLDLGCALLQARSAHLIKPLETSGQLEYQDSLSAADENEIALEFTHPNGETTPSERIVVLDLARHSLRINGRTPTAAVMITPNACDQLLLCFCGDAKSTASAEALEILELLAEGVACMIDLQRNHAQRRISDQGLGAGGIVKTLEEYQQSAALPEVYGVPARVLEVLQRRVGRLGLSIGEVADDLNLSKRTLQRRLQQHNINFADLRDQVRFHHAISFLIHQELSIDSISTALDFSDRTSFTNAFKRWTGLSPSTFRKLFRDYV
ncbi:MAG TPA: helix-turn-helix domain-containing protein [Cellvibrionaceae bacterium]|nr:helix-turn-helix domain-containing protein [Cellvibrionaceae bacterium]HNG61440.1 helix-turn-helix domain-containing protein [Cellvibrionaceae bacterium]